MARWPRSLGVLATFVGLAVLGQGRRVAASEDAHPGTRTDRVLVKPDNTLGLVSLLLDKATSVKKHIPGTDWRLVKVPDGLTAAEFVAELNDDNRVVKATLDLGVGEVEGAGSTIPAGGLMLSAEIPSQSEFVRIGAAAAMGRATGAGVRVAVIDTGVLGDHDALVGHIETGGYDYVEDDSDPTDETNGVDDDNDGNVDEQFAHGTFVASLILALAPDAAIRPYRVLNADGIGSSSDVAQAIAAAVAAGVDVINLSLRVPAEDSVIRSAIGYAAGQGVQVVVAAGNSGVADASQTISGAGVLMVTSVDEDDTLADFASFGQAVSLSAPGVDLSGAYPDDPDTAIWSGTSFSAALVSGACVLLRELHPTWSLGQVKTQLLDTAVNVDAANSGHEDDIGVGRLDLDAATDE